MSGEPTITVMYPLARNGGLVVAKEELPRRVVLARLSGLEEARWIRSDPSFVVVTLLNDAALRAWLVPEEIDAIVALAPDEEFER